MTKPFMIQIGLLFLLLLSPQTTVYAHPHIFIVQRLDAVFDDKGLTGIRVLWELDDMFANMIAEDHDRNRNGTLEAAEVKQVKEKAFSFIAKQNYFMHIHIDRKPFEVKFITDFNAVLSDKRLIYEFFIPCHVTATAQPKTITVAGYDTTYYTAIFFAAKSPVTLTSADAFEVKTAVREDPDTTIYYDMVHPWTLFLEFQKKS